MMDSAIAHDGALKPDYNTSVSSAPDSSLPEALKPKPKRHTRKRSEDHILRPPNAFMLFRSNFLKETPSSVKFNQQNISCMAADSWKRLTLPEKQVWKDLAKKEKEKHMKKYPNYVYKPERNVPTQTRRSNTGARKEAEEHCTNVREMYCTNTAEPIPQPKESRAPRSRKSRAKPRVVDATPRQSPRSTRQSRAQAHNTPSDPPAAPSGPAFIDPLRPPSPQPDAKESFPFVNETLDPALEPPVFHDIPLTPGTNLEMDDEWFSENTSAVSTPAPVEQQIPLNAAAHIREQYDIARQSATFSYNMMDIDSQDAQALYDSVPFFVPITEQHAHNSSSHAAPTFEGQNMSSSTYQDHLQASPASIPSFDAPHLFPTMGLDKIEDFEALAGRSTPQPFPMTMELAASELWSASPEMLQLLPPVFDKPPNPLDTFTLSFDERSLEAVGVDGEYNLFGQALEQGYSGLHVDTSLMGDILNVDVC